MLQSALLDGGFLAVAESLRKSWGARGGEMLLRPEGAAAAAHIIGYKLPIRLLPKLDLRLSHVATRPLSVAKALSRFEVHEKIFDAAGYRRED